MPTHPESPLPRTAAMDRSRASGIRVARESRETEGERYSPLPNVSIIPSNVSSVVRDQLGESDELAAMRARFLVDFAGGAMGKPRDG